MTIIQARRAIAKVAKQQGISVDQCRAKIQEAINAAWATTDPLVKQRQVELVGEGRVPTPEEFIVLVAGRI